MIRCNGHPVLSARITLPTIGAWVASLELDTDETIAGVLRLEDDSGAFFATSVRSGVSGSACLLEAVGGRGGFSPNAPDIGARSYQDVTARSIFEDVLAVAGERLSATSSSLSQQLPFWTRGAGRASAALALLADAVGVRWRVLRDGSVWVGTETWSNPPSSYEAEELDRDPRAAAVLLAPDTLDLAPGMLFNGERVGRVEHVISRDEPLRTTFWLEP